MLLSFTTLQLLAQEKPATTLDDEPRRSIRTGFNAPLGPIAQPTGMDQMRLYPYPGPPGAPTHGYPNYDVPDRHFDIWFRPQFWGVTKRERCAIPDPWRPRGFGNLFARPSTSHRMDYHRYVLVDALTGYGPSYYLRQPDQRCCVRTCDGHIIYLQSRTAMWDLEESLYGYPAHGHNGHCEE